MSPVPPKVLVGPSAVEGFDLLAASSEAVGSVVDLVNAHVQASGVILNAKDAWRLPEELFLVGLLAEACSDLTQPGQFKRSCLQAFRLNEAGAAGCLQRWWRSKCDCTSLLASPPCDSGAALADREESDQAASARTQLDMGLELVHQQFCDEKNSLLECSQDVEASQALEATEDTTAALLVEESAALPHAAEETTADCVDESAKPQETVEDFISAVVVEESAVLEPSDLSEAVAEPCPRLAPAGRETEERPEGAELLDDGIDPAVSALFSEQGRAPDATSVATYLLGPDPAAPSAMADDSGMQAVGDSLSGLARQAGEIVNVMPVVESLQSRDSAANYISHPAESSRPLAVIPSATPGRTEPLSAVPQPPSSLPTPRGGHQKLPRPNGFTRDIAPRPPPLSALDRGAIAHGLPAAHAPGLAVAGAFASARADTLALYSGENSCVSSPSGSVPEVKDASQCRGNRGENPYRRKWNPRKAAAQRRDREKLERVPQQQRVVAEDTEQQTNIAEDFLPGPPSVNDIRDIEEEDAAARIIAASRDLAPEPVRNHRQRAEAPAEVFRSTGNSSADQLNYGSGQAGFSLSAPSDRGPEHRPGTRDRNAATSEFDEVANPDLSELKPAGVPEVYGPPPTLDTKCTGKQGVYGSVPKRPSRDAEAVDFTQLQQMISRGIASAEAGEEPDVEIDEFALAAAQPAPAARPSGGITRRAENGQRSASPRASAFRASVAAASASQDFLPSSDAAPSADVSSASSAHPAQPQAPKRTMADIRAAAERRAFQNSTPTGAGTLLDDESEARRYRDQCSEEPAACAGTSHSNMASIRAIAERRARNSQGGSVTPVGARARTPSQGISCRANDGSAGLDQHQTRTARSGGTPITGAYRPTHAYSGRSAEGGSGLAESLGLRFGVPPPSH